MSAAPSPDLRHLDATSVQAFLRRMALTAHPPWLHAEVARRMAQRLDIIRLKPESVLDWWSYAGAGTEWLDKAYPHARRLIVEPTAALRARSARTRSWWSPKRWRGPPVDVLAPDEVAAASVQLVWANMMLHASINPPSMLARWHRALAVGGFVMFSCLGPGTLRELRDLYRRLGWPPPMAEQVDMHDLGDMLVRAGFADPVMDQEVISLSWSSAEALLLELRDIGTNASPQRFAGLRTPRWKARLIDALQAQAADDGRIHLSIEVAYGHAFKTAPRVPLSAESTVSLDDMRAMVRKRAQET